MAYINKENVIDIIDNSADIQEVKSCVFMLENADVVERAEYDFIVKNRDYYKDKYEHFLQLYDTYRHKNITLKNKIDKAIENIKQDIIAHSGTGEEVIQAYCDGLKKTLEYLENIGELKA